MQRMEHPERQIAKAVLVLAAIVAAGTAGYVLVEGWPVWDALYMTVTTVTTVGFREVHGLSRGGELFTMLLIVAGVGGVLYTLNVIVRLALEGELTGALAGRRLRQRIERMQDHIILCGYGRVGEEVARTLHDRRHPFIVIERDPEALAAAEAAGYTCRHGDATRDEVLQAAGIDRAAGLVAALDSDADNSWVVLSARGLNPRLRIVARADHPGSEGKLRQAGADRVVTPASIAGGHMALAVIQPFVMDFTQTLIRRDGIDLTLAQVTVEPGSALDGVTLGEALQGQGSLTVLGYRDGRGRITVQPASATRLVAGDELIVLGALDDLERISAGMGPGRAADTRQSVAES